MSEKKIYYLSKRELKRAKVKAKVRENWYAFRNFVRENGDVLLFMAPVAMAGIGLFKTGLKGLVRHGNLRKEQRNKDLYCYDPRLGHYWKLKRELRNDEWRVVDRRRKKGERLSEILSDMRVLK